MWTILLIVVAGITVAVLASRVLSAKSAPATGSPAPDFSLKSQAKDFTTGCTMEAHNFQRDQAEYARRNAVILGVSLDSAESHKNFCAKEGLNFKLLADTSHQVSKQYGSLMNFGIIQISSRHTFLIDPEGNIAHAFTSVNPSRHSREMLAAIDDMEKARVKAAK